MTDERYPCTNPDCTRTILAATVAVTGGLCGTCRREQAQREWGAYVAANRRTVDPFAGIADPVALIQLILQPRKYDPLEEVLPPPQSLEHLYANLAADEAARLISVAVSAMEQDDRDLAEEIMRCLVCFTTHAIDPLLDAFVAHNHYTPAIAFSRAGPSIRDMLLRRIGEDGAQHNELLLALAWIGDAQVVAQFAAWRDEPPGWAAELFVSPEKYALAAGWELAADNTRRDLFYAPCYALRARTGPKPSPVTVVGPTTETCYGCDEPLVALFTIDCTAPELAWLDVSADALVIRTCTTCAIDGAAIYFDADADRQPAWHPNNEQSDDLPDTSGWQLPADQLELAELPRAPIYAASWLLPTRFSQLGGYPTWIDDARFPPCPDCALRMRFLAQLAVEDVVPGEGIFYAFLCPACRICTTSYQQT